jgi:hypothetical protein
MIRANAGAWGEVLAAPGASERPRSDKWSPLAYACHVRDVHRLYEENNKNVAPSHGRCRLRKASRASLN